MLCALKPAQTGSGCVSLDHAGERDCGDHKQCPPALFAVRPIQQIQLGRVFRMKRLSVGTTDRGVGCVCWLVRCVLGKGAVLYMCMMLIRCLSGRSDMQRTGVSEPSDVRCQLQLQHPWVQPTHRVNKTMHQQRAAACQLAGASLCLCILCPTRMPVQCTVPAGAAAATEVSAQPSMPIRVCKMIDQPSEVAGQLRCYQGGQVSDRPYGPTDTHAAARHRLLVAYDI